MEGKKVILERIPVNSSNLKSIGYDPVNEILEVEFYKRGSGAGGDVWRYYPVHKNIYERLMESKTIGGFFATVIKANKEIKSEKQ